MGLDRVVVNDQDRGDLVMWEDPLIYTPAALRLMVRTCGKLPNKKFPTLKGRLLAYRLHCAWLVFTGRCDLISWEGFDDKTRWVNWFSPREVAVEWQRRRDRRWKDAVTAKIRKKIEAERVAVK